MIRVALIGYGYAGRTFHAPLIRGTAGLELVAIASSRAGPVHADLPGIPVMASFEEACALPSVELVVVATPNDTHLAIATTALEAGKHVVVEKPFGPTLDRARELTSLARAQGRTLAVFHNRRWDGDFLAASAVVAEGLVGRISHFESHFDRYRPLVRDRWRERGGIGSGLWFDLGPHLVDQTLQLFGLPDRVTASLASQRAGGDTDDWAHAILEYADRRVILHTSVLVAARLPRFVLHGTAGSWIKYGMDAQESQLVAAQTAGRVEAAPPREQALYVDGASGVEREMAIPIGDYTRFYRQLRDALRGTGSNPVPPAQALAVTAVVETAIRAAQDGRACTLPLTEMETRAFTRRSGATWHPSG